MSGPPEPIILARDITIVFMPWDGGLAAVLEVGSLTVTLADNVTGDLRLVDWGEGDMLVEPLDECDYLALAAELISQMGRAEEEWSTPDGTSRWIRIHRWLLTIADPVATEHVCCQSPVDAQALFHDWMSDSSTTPLPRTAE